MFNPNKPFGDDPTQDVPAPTLREQLLASLQQRMASVAAPDTSALEANASEARSGSGLARAGIQLSNALMGRVSNGDNQFSTNLDADAAKASAGVADMKQKAAEADKRREELRNGLSTKFVENDNQVARDKAKAVEERETKGMERTSAEGIAKGNNQTSIEVAKINAARERGAGGVSSDQKAINALRDDLDPNKARGGNLAKSQAMINQADRVAGLFEQFPDGNVPKAQTHELAAAVAGLVNGGSAQSQAQINDLTPQSLRGNAEAIAGWLTNDPKGLEQQAYINVLRHTSEREREIALDQVKSAQIPRLAAHGNLKANNPEAYNAILQAYNITPDMIDEKGHYKKAPMNHETTEKKALSPEDQEAVKWAKDPANANTPQAKQILSLHPGA